MLGNPGMVLLPADREALTPYYDDGTVTIYHGDCRALLPQLSADFLLSDPPYGIDHTSSPFWGKRKIVGDAQAFDPAPFLNYPKVILFGANHYAQHLPEGGWLVWNKRERVSRALPGSDAELAWTNCTPQVRIYTHVWMPWGLRDEPPYHPTQKPTALVRKWLQEFGADGETVLDPFMGSGTTLRAAKDLGRKAVGIEIEERYCELAASRLTQEVLSLGT